MFSDVCNDHNKYVYTAAAWTCVLSLCTRRPHCEPLRMADQLQIQFFQKIFNFFDYSSVSFKDEESKEVVKCQQETLVTNG